MIASVLLHEPIGLFTIAGILLVIAGLYIILRDKITDTSNRKQSS